MTIHYDYERLRQAVVLLLDLRYGKTRSEKLRGSIMSDRRPAGDANTVFSRMLDEELQEQYQTAKREQERRRLSDTSRRRLEAKEAYKNSQKTGVSQETLAKLTRKFGGT